MDLVVEADPAELADDLGEGRRLGGQVEEAVAAGAVLEVDRVEHRRQAIERIGVGEVTLVVDDPGHELVDDRGLDRHPRILRERRRDLLAEDVLLVRPPADRHEHELVGQQVGPAELVERRQDLPVGQVAGRAEQDDDARIGDPLQAEALAERVGRLRLLAACACRPAPRAARGSCAARPSRSRAGEHRRERPFERGEPGIRVRLEVDPQDRQLVALEDPEVAGGLGIDELPERVWPARDRAIHRMVRSELEEEADRRPALVELAGRVQESRPVAGRGRPARPVAQERPDPGRAASRSAVGAMYAWRQR